MLKKVLQTVTHLIYPRICLHCHEKLESDLNHFCSFCLQRIQITKNPPKRKYLYGKYMEIAPLLEVSDVSVFIMKASKTLGLSFLGKVIAPLFYLKAIEVGWENSQVISDSDQLQNAFSKLQFTKEDKKLFLSLQEREHAQKKAVQKASRLIYLIDEALI